MYVFQILCNSPEGVPDDYRSTELYRACVAAGLIPSAGTEKIPPTPPLEKGGDKSPPVSRPDPDAGAAGLSPASGPTTFRPKPKASGNPAGGPTAPTAIEEGLSLELSLRIEGMWCVACSWLIEQLLRNMDGVLSASIFFFSDIARIKYMPHRIQPEAIMKGVSRLGYKAFPVESGRDAGQMRDMAFRLGVSAILSMNIMMISFALWAGFFEEIGRDGAAFFSYTLWAIATPVVFYGGWPILRKAFRDMRHMAPTMDTLIAVAVLSAYFCSIAAMLRGGLHVYFDTASMLITLVLLGRFIEIRAKEKISGNITTLFHAASGKVRIARDGRQIWTAPDKVSTGDLFLVFCGERVPVDGRVFSGEAILDESIITGESRPVKKGPGADVPAGSLLLDGEAKFEAACPWGQSSLTQIIALIQEALSTKNRLEQFADRVMRVLVPAVLALSASIAIYLLASSVPAGEALLRALTVLVITCPCALGIAVPLARVAEIARARTSGIIIRNPAALERADSLDVMIFDKTGTITEGSYVLRQTVTLDTDPDEALRRVASAEVTSDHFLAREIVRAARRKSIELEEILSFEPMEGLGIIALTRSGEVIAGARGLMLDNGLEFSDELEKRAHDFETAGSTVVFFAWSGSVQGFFVFGDTLRANAREIITRLRGEGISVWVVSGDSEQTTRAIALEAGADEWAGQRRPRDKVQIIKDFQAQGKRVAMAGDGVNDAAALACSDLGITIGAGANLIRECSDAAILGDDLEKIPGLFGLARFSLKIVRQNLFFSFLYNAIAIPIAAAGILNPLIAAFAMFASSVTVISNTLRISKFTSTPDSST
jgi:heavy metal translocating P-type ATPase